MTYAEKLALAAEMRAGTALETGLPPDDLGSVTATKEKAYVAPNGWKLSKVPMPPADISEDLSHLNPKARGRTGNRKQ